MQFAYSSLPGEPHSGPSPSLVFNLNFSFAATLATRLIRFRQRFEFLSTRVLIRKLISRNCDWCRRLNKRIRSRIQDCSTLSVRVGCRFNKNQGLPTVSVGHPQFSLQKLIPSIVCSVRLHCGHKARFLLFIIVRASFSSELLKIETLSREPSNVNRRFQAVKPPGRQREAGPLSSHKSRV